MKKNFLVFAMSVMISINVHSTTTRTVSNDLAGGSTYATLQLAYDASSTGDTLLVEATNVAYSLSGNWAKPLIVIGIGFNPMKSSPRQTIFPGLTMSAAGSNSKFYGIRFNSNLTPSGAIVNYAFEDCLFEGYVNFSGVANVSGISFRNCIFIPNNNVNFYAGTNGQPYSNVVFTSCVFNGYIDGQGNTVSGITVDHSLFLGTNNALNNLQNSIIKNSIFMNLVTIAFNNTINNTFTNNISRLATVYPPAGNTGSGNLNTPLTNDTLFIKYTALNFYSSTHNYHLRTSPVTIAASAATDGTDIGPHGGLSNFSETGEVLINPIIESLNINNTTVVPNGTLNVQIKARKPTDN